ncbi:MAG: metallophosphatase, partial [Oricola sp.]|nr:metallophosphatase [Oricola sp.]
KYDPATIVSLGDAFHDDEASERLGDDALRAIGAIARGRDMVWVTGNHDPSPPEGVPGIPVDMLALGGIVFRHIAEAQETGHEVSGHWHPCARLVRHGKAVRRACFASDGVRLVLPSFGVFTGGLNVRDEAYAGLFHAATFRAYMLGSDRVHAVGPRDLYGD